MMRLIDKDLLIRKYIDIDIAKFNNSDVKIVLENLKQNILKMPTIDRPQGEWIMDNIQRAENTDNDNYKYTCSICGHSDIHAITQEVPYCWWCGARMKGVSNGD